MPHDNPLQLHPDVVTALQFKHGHPRATLLYFRLLTLSAHGANGGCEIQVGSQDALREKLRPGLEWNGVYPLLSRYISDFCKTSSLQSATYHALDKSWQDILKRTLQKFRAHPQYKHLSHPQQRALKKLLVNHALRYKVNGALASIAHQFPFLAVHLQALQLWIQQLQDEAIFMTEIRWLAAAGLLTIYRSEAGLQLLLTPQESRQDSFEEITNAGD